MRKTILKKLDEIEKRENIRILHCIESGSRARKALAANLRSKFAPRL